MYKLKYLLLSMLLVGVFIFTSSVAMPIVKDQGYTWQQEEFVEK